MALRGLIGDLFRRSWLTQPSECPAVYAVLNLIVTICAPLELAQYRRVNRR